MFFATPLRVIGMVSAKYLKTLRFLAPSLTRAVQGAWGHFLGEMEPART